MAESESWQPIAVTLGFEDESEMLKNLYIVQNFSLNQLRSILGYSTWAIRRRLILAGIPLKGKGGPNNRIGRRRLKHVSDQELRERSAANVARDHQVHISTVFAEIRFRKKEKRDEILSDHASKLLSEIRPSE